MNIWKWLLLFIVLFQLSCMVVTKRTKNMYIKIDLFSCSEASERYPKDLFADADMFRRSLIVCGVTYANFLIRKDKIEAMVEMYHHQPITKQYKIVDFKYNIPHCQILINKKYYDVKQTCSQLLEQL